jgi:hypothetical protein
MENAAPYFFTVDYVMPIGKELPLPKKSEFTVKSVVVNDQKIFLLSKKTNFLFSFFSEIWECACLTRRQNTSIFC